MNDERCNAPCPDDALFGTNWCCDLPKGHEGSHQQTVPEEDEIRVWPTEEQLKKIWI